MWHFVLLAGMIPIPFHDYENTKLKGAKIFADQNMSLDQFQFRWLNIKGKDADFPISITLFSNQLN